MQPGEDNNARLLRAIKRIAGIGLVVGGTAVAAPVVGILALNAAGFAAAGVAGGSSLSMFTSIIL